MNEFIIVDELMQTTDHKTLAVGLRKVINQKYPEQWGRSRPAWCSRPSRW